MTLDEVMNEMKSDSKWNQARKVFSSYSAKIEQAMAQRTPLGPIEMRKMEFEAVKKIMEVFGVECV